MGQWDTGAAFAAGWPRDKYNNYWYWSGEVVFYGGGGYFNAGFVRLDHGDDGWDGVGNDYPVAVGVGP